MAFYREQEDQGYMDGFPAIGTLVDPDEAIAVVAAAHPRTAEWLDRELAEGRAVFREALHVEEPGRYASNPAVRECVFLPWVPPAATQGEIQ